MRQLAVSLLSNGISNHSLVGFQVSFWGELLIAPHQKASPGVCLKFSWTITCLTALHKPSRRAILGSPGFFKRQALYTQFSREHWYWRNSNSQPLAPKASAVPIELTWLLVKYQRTIMPRCTKVITIWHETTFCFILPFIIHTQVHIQIPLTSYGSYYAVQAGVTLRVLWCYCDRRYHACSSTVPSEVLRLAVTTAVLHYTCMRPT